MTFYDSQPRQFDFFRFSSFLMLAQDLLWANYVLDDNNHTYNINDILLILIHVSWSMQFLGAVDEELLKVLTK